MGRMDGKVVLVTGAASNPGLGRTTAERLAAEGATLMVTDVDLAGAEACAEAIIAAGGKATAMHQDVTSEEDWGAVMTAVNDTARDIDFMFSTLRNGARVMTAKL